MASMNPGSELELHFEMGIILGLGIALVTDLVSLQVVFSDSILMLLVTGVS